MLKSTALTIALILGLAGCDSDEPEDLMPPESYSEPLTVTNKPEDNRSMDEILTSEMAHRREKRGLPENMNPVTGVAPTTTGPEIATNTGCKNAQAGISTVKCRTPKPIKLSSRDKKKLFDRIAKDRKKNRGKTEYDSRGIPVNEPWQPVANH